MPNPIDIELREDNHISTLNFHWQVILRDSSIINQFNLDGTENKFNLDWYKSGILAYFNLRNNNGKLFSLDLISGLIGFNYLLLPYIESKVKKENIRLIYFRHQRIIMTENVIEKFDVTYNFGVQWNTPEGANYKIIFKIEQDGSFIIGE